MNHTIKTTTLGIATAIAIVTLALVTAAAVVVVSMLPVQKAAAKGTCVFSLKGDEACSGGLRADSFSVSVANGHASQAGSESPGSFSQSGNNIATSHGGETGGGNCATSDGHTVCSGH